MTRKHVSMVNYAGWKPNEIIVKNAKGQTINIFQTEKSCSKHYFPDFGESYLNNKFNGDSKYYSKELQLLFIKHKNKGVLCPNGSCVSWCVLDKQQNKNFKVKSSKELGKLLKLTKRFYKDNDLFGFFENEKYKIWRGNND